MTYRARSKGRKARREEHKRERFINALDARLKIERASIWDDAFRRGAARMREDIMALGPVGEIEITRDVDGEHRRETIPRFPDPKDNPAFEVRLIMPYSSFLRRSYPGATRAESILFRPVQWAITKREYGNTSTLRWYTWEAAVPTDEKTVTYLRTWSKLSAADRFLQHAHDVICYQGDALNAFDLIERATPLVHEVTEELRRLVGRFQAEPNPIDLEARTEAIRYAMPWT